MDTQQYIEHEVQIRVLKETTESKFILLQKNFDDKFHTMEKLSSEKFHSMEKRIDDRFKHIDERFKNLDYKVNWVIGIITVAVAIPQIARFLEMIKW